MAKRSNQRYYDRMSDAITRKRQLDEGFRQSLQTVTDGLASGLVDLTDQRGDLITVRNLIDKALRLNEASTQKVAAGVGHLADNLDGMHSDDATDAIADAATMIRNEWYRIQFDHELVAELGEVLKQAPAEVQAIILNILRNGKDE